MDTFEVRSPILDHASFAWETLARISASVAFQFVAISKVLSSEISRSSDLKNSLRTVWVRAALRVVGSCISWRTVSARHCCTTRSRDPRLAPTWERATAWVVIGLTFDGKREAASIWFALVSER